MGNVDIVYTRTVWFEPCCFIRTKGWGQPLFPLKFADAAKAQTNQSSRKFIFCSIIINRGYLSSERLCYSSTSQDTAELSCVLSVDVYNFCGDCLDKQALDPAHLVRLSDWLHIFFYCPCRWALHPSMQKKQSSVFSWIKLCTLRPPLSAYLWSELAVKTLISTKITYKS